MSGPIIHFPTEEENRQALAEFTSQMRVMRTERRAAIVAAREPLKRLVEVMRERSGQPHHLRAILYSLYNGKDTSVSKLLHFDWQIRKDLCAVLLAFGYEDKQEALFYKELKTAIVEAGQWDWFVAEHEEETR